MVRQGHREAFWAFGLLVGVVTLSCAGAGTDETISSPTAAQNVSTDSEVTFASAALKNKALVCHKGEDKWVPSGAVADHKAHGDTEGRCCPCFSLDGIEAAVGFCVGDSAQSVVSECTPDAGLVLSLTCVTGGTGGSTAPLGSYAATDPDPGGAAYCLRYKDVLLGTSGPEPLTDSELTNCLRVLTSTGYCP